MSIRNGWKFAAVIAVLLVGGAGWLMIQKNSAPPSGSASAVRVGLSFDSIVVERWKRDMETFVAAANKKGIDVDVQIANDDLNEQKKQIQYLIDKDVQVLVILPKEKDAFTDLISRARRKGIRVIAYDRLIMDADYDAYVSFENVGVGEMLAGRLIRELTQVGHREADIVIINGDPKDNNSMMLNQGFYRVLDKLDDTLRVQVVSETWAPGWRENYARETMEALLDAGTVPDGIIAANDVLATAAIQTLAERQLAGQVLVVSMDAELSACQRIVEGTQLATVYKPYNALAQNAVDICLQLIDGTFRTAASLPNGAFQIPTVALEGTLVDRSNIDAVIIESGFHSRDDVYRNVKQ